MRYQWPIYDLNRRIFTLKQSWKLHVSLRTPRGAAAAPDAVSAASTGATLRARARLTVVFSAAPALAARRLRVLPARGGGRQMAHTNPAWGSWAWAMKPPLHRSQ